MYMALTREEAKLLDEFEKWTTGAKYVDGKFVPIFKEGTPDWVKEIPDKIKDDTDM